jgi:adenylate cyclase
VRDKLPYPFEDRGEQSVKNIARPVRVYAISAVAVAATPLVAAGMHLSTARRSVIPKPSTGSLAARPAPRLSIVVLPFANLSSDPEQEYFADAITDDLTTDLTRITDSFVISRNTAFTYKGKAVDVNSGSNTKAA